MSKGGGAKQRVVDYFISAHYGVVAEADEVLELRYGEKRLWSGSVTENTQLSIDAPELFGGRKVEGGFRGTVNLMLGGPTQLVPQRLANMLQRSGATDTADPEQLPGFRGLFSFFVSGGGPSSRNGANIGSNTGSLKSWWVKLRRAPKGAPFSTTINVAGMQLSNPAGIIWECLTNTQWGMSAPSSQLDADSFTAAAATLASEGFGIALLWHQQQTIEEFVGVVLDHIEGTLALDPFTGRFRLKLIRRDYDIETLPVFGPHNAELTQFERRAWGETINEINVVWTNPVNEQQETVTVHDTANINLQGGHTISETREYIGIRTAELALLVASRDLMAASSALAAAELRVDRSAWAVLPGDVIPLTWPRLGIELMAMRVSNVNYGKPGDSKVTLTLIEDVFALPDQSYVSSDGSAWVNPAIAPQPLSHQHLTSVPYYVLAQSVGDADAQALDDTSDVEIGFGTHPAGGIQSFEMVEQITDSLGNLVWQDRGTVQPAGRAVLAAPLVREVSSLVEAFDDMARGYFASPGALVWIGPIDDTGELAIVTTVDSNGHALRRGILDTVPQAWPVGTPVWFLPDETLGNTGDERLISETVTLRYLTRTALGRLPVAEASDVSSVMSGRLHLPYRPANVRVAGVLWPDPEAETTFPADMTWSGRNRLEETTLITAWSDGQVSPEDGVTFEVVLSAEDGAGTVTQFHVEDVGTATSYAIDLFDTPPPGDSHYVIVEARSKRDGLSSWQAVSHRLRINQLLAEDGTGFEAEDGEQYILEDNTWG